MLKSLTWLSLSSRAKKPVWIITSFFSVVNVSSLQELIKLTRCFLLFCSPEYLKNNVDYGLVKPANCDSDDTDSMIVPTYADAANPSGSTGSRIELTNTINYTQIMNRGPTEDVKLPVDISPWMDNGGEVYKAPAFYNKCWNRTAGAFPANCTGDCISNYNLWGNEFRSFGELTCSGVYPPTQEETSTVYPPAGTVSVSFYFLQVLLISEFTCKPNTFNISIISLYLHFLVHFYRSSLPTSAHSTCINLRRDRPKCGTR